MKMDKREELITFIRNFINENTEEIIKEFGTWKNAFNVANVQLDKHNKYTDDEIIKTLIDFYREYGENASEYRYKQEKRKPYPSTIYNRFGTWNNAIKQAGIEKIRKPIKKLDMTDQDLINILKEADKEITGNLSKQKYDEWAKSNKKVRANTIIKRFKTWNDALRKANIR
jgi:hypothetical protein